MHVHSVHVQPRKLFSGSSHYNMPYKMYGGVLKFRPPASVQSTTIKVLHLAYGGVLRSGYVDSLYPTKYIP